MKDKIFLYAFIILGILFTVMAFYVYSLNKEITDILERQDKEFEVLKKQNLAELDSIISLKNKREATIDEKEIVLYRNMAKINDNNFYYEDIKKSIRNSNDADSLARELTKRYQK